MEIFGHNHLQQYFNNLISGGNLAQGYLFWGPAGVGKRTFALELAKKLGARALPDLILVEPEGGSLRTEKISQLRRELSLKPYRAAYKVVILEELETATRAAFNGLLKSLEEPYSDSLIIGITKAKSVIPATVVSRLQEIRFNPLSAPDLEQFLQAKTTLAPKERQVLIKLSGGIPSRALQLAEKIKKDPDFFDKIQASFALLAKDSLAQRFKLSETLSQDRQLALEQVEGWLMVLYLELTRGSKGRSEMVKLIEKLGVLRGELRSSRLNLRLLLDEFVLSL
jgi:DNA polymerase-3 subunit delta'